jgi:hypothetical protein
MMRPFLTSLSAACCSLGILTLAQCGGSSSDAEGLAPSTIGSKVLNMQVTGITVPAIFDMTTGDNGAFIIQTQGENMNMWNGAGIYSYTKTGKNTAELSLSYNRNSGSSSEPNTLMSTIRIPQLTFENATHASSGEGGASISYMQAEDRTPIPIDGITISVNIISQS